MEFIYYILLFFLGASIGSFSSVVLYRLKNNLSMSIVSRSSCPNCKNQLHWYSLVPILSYLFQKGKCTFCATKIPIRYLFLELIAGTFFVSLGTIIDVQYNFLILVSLGWVLAGAWILTSYDYFYKLVEDKVVIPFLIGIVLILLYQDYSQSNLISLYTLQFSHPYGLLEFGIQSIPPLTIIGLLYYTIFSNYHYVFIVITILLAYLHFVFLQPSYLFFASIGAIIFFVFFYLQILVTRGRGLGGGDLRFSIILGLLYGFFIIQGIFATYILSLIVVILLVIKLRKIKGVELPFGPLLFLAYFILLCYYR